MDRLTAMRVFIEVSDRGSLTQAAEELDMSLATVSRYLASLENWLGARLLHRTTRRISLSDAGQEALPFCRQLLELAQEIEVVTGNRRHAPSGKLRITTSLSFAQAQLTGAIVEFQKSYPGIEVELLVADRTIDLVAERIDLAIRITNVLDEQLLARRLTTCRSVLCAAPDYLQRHGYPATPQELSQHSCITHAFGSGTEYHLQQQQQNLRISVSGQVFSNETAILRQAALAGGGIALLPTYYVVDDICSGALIPLLSDCKPETMDIHAVYLSRQHQPQALRLLIEFLAQRFGGELPPWDKQWMPPASKV
ncbi:LysR family transcriptional regulator [Neisseriaceae bacterium TC5R-5]|nr:LysR family transcriptional regulator [Neisseriaceae bacterium TC5R-5]